MNASNIFLFASITNLITNIPWTAIFFITQFFGIRLYTIHRLEECQRIQKRVGNRTSETGDGGKGKGWAFGYWYFLHINNNSGEMNIWMIATAATYDKLLKNTDESPIITEHEEETSVKKVRIVQRAGSFSNPWFRTRNISISLTPRPLQQSIIDKILEHQKSNPHTVAYIWGPPGTGKSMVGLFIAQQNNGSYCNTLKPWKPNDTIEAIYLDIEPSKSSPIIIVFDEFDNAIVNIHAGNIISHKNLPIAIENKSGWNHMLDEIQRGMYPHLILLLTSNRDPNFFNGLDPSYLREGRVDLTFEVPSL
jgi:hypothetical protein